MKKLSLQEVLAGIEDPRRKMSVLYPLHEVLFIMLVGVICGATSYVKIELFGKSREAWLKKYLALENGIPDACTFRNVIRQIDTTRLHELFVVWMRNAVESISGVVAIDGKQARRTKDTKQKPLHVVSAFSAECRLVLGQLSCEEKSNEITAIPQLIEMLELEGCIVTIDAEGTQTEIARKIREKKADYILALKSNQPSLYEDVRLFFETEGPDSDYGVNYAKQISQGHGRVEVRECFTCETIDWLSSRDKWAGLNGIGMIRAQIQKGETSSEQRHFFIYSCKNMSAERLLIAKRSHWEIENGLHWVLDTTFREDESRARRDHSAENFNVLRHMAYNILKSDSSLKGSFSDKQFKCLLDSSYLEKILSLWFCS